MIQLFNKRKLIHADDGKGNVNIDLLFEPSDLWIGCFWHCTKSIESAFRKLDVYICVVPMLPLHLEVCWGWK